MKLNGYQLNETEKSLACSYRKYDPKVWHFYLDRKQSLENDNTEEIQEEWTINEASTSRNWLVPPIHDHSLGQQQECSGAAPEPEG